MNRRHLLTHACALLSLAPMASQAQTQSPARPRLEVWKTASCGCCKDWVKHVQAAGFEVKAHDVSDDAKRQKASSSACPRPSAPAIPLWWTAMWLRGMCRLGRSAGCSKSGLRRWG